MQLSISQSAELDRMITELEQESTTRLLELRDEALKAEKIQRNLARVITWVIKEREQLLWPNNKRVARTK